MKGNRPRIKSKVEVRMFENKGWDTKFVIRKTNLEKMAGDFSREGT